ncbi:MAG TPA: carbonic anhydrase family protein [Thermoanaerobaculia bacterium]|nr:carbonic anhydrase family protein [Thermoanaerobaculia bacterium]
MRITMFVLALALVSLDSAEAQICGAGPVWNYCTCGGCAVNGPANWARIANPACGGGTIPQSPAALPGAGTYSNIGPLTLHYGTAATLFSTENNASTVKLFPAAAQFIHLGPLNKRYNLKELHFHVPAEHVLPGVNAVAELHLVHEAAGDPTPVAIAVFLVDSQGAPNNALVPVLTAVNAIPLCTRRERSVTANLSQIVPSGLAARFLEYAGSLTTPPCGAVRWIILPQPIPISSVQLGRLNLFGSNARPLQAPAARVSCYPRSATCVQ